MKLGKSFLCCKALKREAPIEYWYMDRERPTGRAVNRGGEKSGNDAKISNFAVIMT